MARNRLLQGLQIRRYAEKAQHGGLISAGRGARASSTDGNGLSIAKAIAEAHKGTIEAENNNGNDITFRAKLKAV